MGMFCTEIWREVVTLRERGAGLVARLDPDDLPASQARRGGGATCSAALSRRASVAMLAAGGTACLCPHRHDLKTHHGWELVDRSGNRPFVPAPDHPDCPDHPDHRQCTGAGSQPKPRASCLRATSITSGVESTRWQSP